MKEKTRCTIYIVRHGQSVTNKHDTYGLDKPLTTIGINQAKKRALQFKNIPLNAVYSSNLIRAKQTAEIIAEPHNLKVVTLNSLKERFYGVLEGRKGSETKKEFLNLYEKRSQLGYDERIKFKFSQDYESDEEVKCRFFHSLKYLAKKNKGKIILVVSHAVTMKILLLYLKYATHKELDNRGFVNTGYVKLKLEKNDFIIEEVVGK